MIFLVPFVIAFGMYGFYNLAAVTVAVGMMIEYAVNNFPQE